MFSLIKLVYLSLQTTFIFKESVHTQNEFERSNALLWRGSDVIGLGQKMHVWLKCTCIYAKFFFHKKDK